MQSGEKAGVIFLLDNICIWKYTHICKKIKVISQIANLKLVIRLKEKKYIVHQMGYLFHYNKEAHL